MRSQLGHCDGLVYEIRELELSRSACVDVASCGVGDVAVYP
jgi:hypothetical protein